MQRTELTGGRGWLAAPAAASVHRIDRQLGRAADINEAGRSPEQADKNHAAWLAFLAGGPKAPYALPARLSVHCQGMAVDSDDWYSRGRAVVWRANGWRQTARYPNDPKKDEPWHGEYFIALDQHRFDPALSGAATTPPKQEEDEDMLFICETPINGSNDAAGRNRWICDPGAGTKRNIGGEEYDFYRYGLRIRELQGLQSPAITDRYVQL